MILRNSSWSSTIRIIVANDWQNECHRNVVQNSSVAPSTRGEVSKNYWNREVLTMQQSVNPGGQVEADARGKPGGGPQGFPLPIVVFSPIARAPSAGAASPRVSAPSPLLPVGRPNARGAPPGVLLEPQDRGPGPAVLFAGHWIRQWDPEAIVAVFPSDHFILEEEAFSAHTGQVLAHVANNPELMVLLGAPPTRPEPEYGWIRPGEWIGDTGAGPVFRVGGFVEKPEPERARRCLAT